LKRGVSESSEKSSGWIIYLHSLDNTYSLQSLYKQAIGKYQYEMSDERTSINIEEKVRDELRRYKAQDGLTYDEAIVRLLSEVEWIGEDAELIDLFEDAEDDEKRK